VSTALLAHVTSAAVVRGIERNMAIQTALRELVALIDLGKSSEYAALQEHRAMRNARALTNVQEVS